MSCQMQYILKGATYHSIIPVPLHPKRLRERGFNQALFLARSVSRKYEIPLDSYSLTSVSLQDNFENNDISLYLQGYN